MVIIEKKQQGKSGRSDPHLERIIGERECGLGQTSLGREKQIVRGVTGMWGGETTEPTCESPCRKNQWVQYWR